MIDEIVSFLQASALAESNGGQFKTIDYAFTMEAVEDIGQKQPALFVYPTSMESGPRLSSNRARQRTDYFFVVQVISRIESHEVRQNELFDVLIGHQVNATSDMIEHHTGKILGIKDPIIWYANTFRFNTKLGS